MFCLEIECATKTQSSFSSGKLLSIAAVEVLTVFDLIAHLQKHKLNEKFGWVCQPLGKQWS